MAKVPAYPTEFRVRAVELYRSSGLTLDQAARQVGVSTTTMGNWVRQAAIDAGETPGVTTAEHGEVVALRKENVLPKSRSVWWNNWPGKELRLR